MAIQSASLSDRGRRKNNEDFAAFFEPTDPTELRNSGSLYIIADGVGGAAKGERASQFAARKIMYEYYQPSTLEPLERLREILQRVNDEIYSYATQNHTRMATTLVAAVVRGGFLYVANIGDSRAYLIRTGSVTQINRDHSIVGEMMEHREMTEAEAMVSKIKNRLTRSLGGDEDVTVDTYAPIPLKTGDKILLCSDGLTRYALREDVARMTADGKPEEISQKLVQFANRKGGADNTSVIVALYQGVEVLEPTIVIPRPRPVEQLDTWVTEPGISAIKKHPLHPVAVIAVLFLVIALGSVSFFFGNAIMALLLPIPTPTTTPTASIIHPTSITLANPIGGDPISPTFTATFTSTVTPSDSDLLSVPSPTATPMPTPTETGNMIDLDYLCIYLIKSGDNISKILNIFGLTWDPVTPKPYYYCKLDNNSCIGQEPIPVPGKIWANKWLIIDDVRDQTICTTGTGMWVQDARSK